MPWSAIASIAGGLLGSDAAGDAAAAQASATREANQLQREMWQKNLELQQPAVDAGNLARNRLLQLLGLGGTPGGMPTTTREQLRSQLLSKYTTQGQGPATGGYDINDPTQRMMYGDRGEGGAMFSYPGDGKPATSTVDETGLNAAIEAELAKRWIDSSAGDYGSLMRNFTGADLENEPGYQFGLSEGQKALDRKAAAGGGYFSGAALKAAQRFGQDYAGTKYGEAFNRDTTNKTNAYNRLAGLTGSGQVAANQVGVAGQEYANRAGANLTAMGNAQGAAGIAGANSWTNALNGAVNNWQANNQRNGLLNAMRGGSGYGYETPPYYDYGMGGFQ